MRTKIIASSYVLPEHCITTLQVEDLLQKNSSIEIPRGVIDFVLGVEKRFWTKDSEYSSTLAVGAIKKLQQENSTILDGVDLLIYASATQDCIEPATSCIIQQAIGLSCPTFDVQNACNSFVTAFDIANAYIITGTYKKILLCSGETPSKSIQFIHHSKESFKESFSSFGLGDCGVAMVLEGVDKTGGIIASHFYTDGSKRQEATILGGGSMYPHDINKNYFVGNPIALKDYFSNQGRKVIDKIFHERGISLDQIAGVFVHQVSNESYKTAIEVTGITEHKFTKIYASVGNVASCSIPLQISQYGLQEGGLYLILGLGAGATFACILYQH